MFKKIPRSFIFLMVLIGVGTLSLTISTHFICNYIHIHLDGAVYGGIRLEIKRSGVHVNPFNGGLRLSGLRVLNRHSSVVLSEFKDIFLGLSYRSLWEKHLELSRLEFYGINSSIEGILKTFSDIFLSGEEETLPEQQNVEKGSFGFDYLAFLPPEVIFQGVVFSDLQNYLVTENQALTEFLNLKMVNSLSFAGTINPQDDGLMKIKARPFVFFDAFSAEKMPVEATLIFSPSHSRGQFNLNVAGLSVEQFLSYSEINLSGGTLTMNTAGDFLFAGPDIEEAGDFNVLPMSDNLNFYYRVDGECRVFSPRFSGFGLDLSDIYLKLLWNAHRLRLEKGQAGLFGGLLVLEGGLDDQEKWLQIKADSLQISRIINSLPGAEKTTAGFDNSWSGSLSTEISFGKNGSDWHFAPVMINDLAFSGVSIPLDRLEVQSISALPPGTDFAMQLAVYPHESARELFGVCYINSDADGLVFQKQLHNVSLSAMEEYMNFSTLSVAGFLNADIAGRFNFASRNWFLNIDGRLQKVDLGGLPLENAEFYFRSTGSSAHVSGRVLLPVGDGQIDFAKDFYAGNQGLELYLHEVELSYPAHVIRNYPVSGQCTGRLNLSFSPDLGADLNMELDRFSLPGAFFGHGFLSGRATGKEFKLEFQHDEGRASISGQINTADLLSFPGGRELVFFEIVPRFSFEIVEDKLERFSAFAAYQTLGLSGGQAVISAEFDGSEARGKVQQLHLAVGGAEWILQKPFDWYWREPHFVEFAADLHSEKLADNSYGRLNISAQGDDYQLVVERLDLALLADFLGFEGLKARGNLKAEGRISRLFSNPELNLSLHAADVLLDYEKRISSLERVSGEITVGRDLIHLHKVEIVQKTDIFSVKGKIPCVFNPAGGEFQLLGKEPLDLSLHLPETPLVFIKELFPAYIKKITGFFQAHLQVGGCIESPLLTGEANLHMSALEMAQANEYLSLQNVRLGMVFEKENISVREFQGKWENVFFNLSGHLSLAPVFSWELNGEVNSDEFNNNWLVLRKPHIRNIVLGGNEKRLNFVGTLVAESGSLFYEKLLTWLDKPKTVFSLPGFSVYDFNLRIEDLKKTELRSDFFRMDMAPKISVRLRPEGVFLEGVVNIAGGHIDIVRNRFQVEPDSYIRFVSHDEDLIGGRKFQSGKFDDIWDSDEFLRGGLGRKLSILWDQDSRRGRSALSEGSNNESRLFDTRLRIHAKSRLRNNDVSLILSGAVDKLDYVLSSEDKTMSSEDIMRELASKGIGASTVSNEEGRSRSEQDAELISRQFTAQLEDKFLGRYFEEMLSSVFNLSEFQLQPNLTGEKRGFVNLRMGTSLSDDIYLSHEQESNTDFVKSRTRLKYRLDDHLNLFWQKDKKSDYKFDLGIKDDEDVQFGFERKIRF